MIEDLLMSLTFGLQIHLIKENPRGILFGGPFGPKFELFQNVYYFGCVSKVKHNITHL